MDVAEAEAEHQCRGYEFRSAEAAVQVAHVRIRDEVALLRLVTGQMDAGVADAVAARAPGGVLRYQSDKLQRLAASSRPPR